MDTKALVVPAAGSGTRMERDIPKPYLELSGSTILEHTIRRFLPVEGLVQVIVATSEEYSTQAGSLLEQVLPDGIDGVSLVGGKERQDTIRKALQHVSDTGLVMVHDAVRPFVMPEHIEKCCAVASRVGAAVLGVPAKDTIKRIDRQYYVQETPDRSVLWQAQTPQIFQKEVIEKAFAKADKDNFRGTDDASLVEYMGHKVKMVEGDRQNFKITYPLDLDIARILIEKYN